MAGMAGRSGGRNRKASSASGDGPPDLPRALTPRAAVLFQWLCERLGANDPRSGFNRVDGTVLASFAECLEDCERLASALADDPTNLGLLRCRGQAADRVKAFSGLLGCTPFDRARMPEPTADNDEPQDAYSDLMRRMSQG